MTDGPPVEAPTAPARHPYATEIAALVVAALAAYAVAEIIGLRQVGHAFDHLHPGWLAVEFAAQGLSVLAYVGAYRAVVARIGGRRLGFAMSIQLVLTGFGPLAVAGGFASDERALQRLGVRRQVAILTVLVLSGVELIALVWIAFGAALVALLVDSTLSGGLVWPWLIAVPSGTAIAVAIGRAERPEDVTSAHPATRAILTGLRDVLHLTRHPRQLGRGWLGIVAYWLLDMAALGFALRTFGVSPTPEAIVLAYATGYLVSRRTLPLGGAGFVEFVMTFSLYWVHVPLARALGGVILYRAFDLGLTALRAAVARLRLEAALRDLDQPNEW